jgi:hypothetical protein
VLTQILQIISAARNRQWWMRIKWWVGLVFFAFFVMFLVFHFNFGMNTSPQSPPSSISVTLTRVNARVALTDPHLRRAGLLDVLVDPYAGVLPIMVGLLVLLVGGTLFIPRMYTRDWLPSSLLLSLATWRLSPHTVYRCM